MGPLIKIVNLYPWSIPSLVVAPSLFFCRPCQLTKSEFKDEDVKLMMYSSLCSTNISYAAAFVYLSAKDKSCRKTSTAPVAFNVNYDIC